MTTLTGDTLGKRQQELNAKVREAIHNNVNFDEIKSKDEKSDVDRLFKIDLASKHKNLEYIIETLKSGDNLYISRAIKCTWIYDDEYSAIINTDYLHYHVFPFMAIKMKKKLLSTISVNVKNEKRAVLFYNYCVNTKLNDLALKFLCSTSVAFKIDFINNKMKYSKTEITVESSCLMDFIGKSFDVTDAFLQKVSKYEKNKALFQLRFLYSIANENYLDRLENNYSVGYSSSAFGRRLSKDIFTKYKSRIHQNPMVYINVLHKQVICNLSTVDDANFFLNGLLPQDEDRFWSENYCQNYKFLLELIPLDERFEFLKRIFTDKYSNKPFEMTPTFYYKEYYKLLMTDHEKEQWALRHLASQEEILGTGNDFIWYKFVNFEKSFVGIKRYIMITQDKRLRSKMINILIESAKTQEDLTAILKYYYVRHVNEDIGNKYSFLDLIFCLHNIFQFEENCWTAFDDILHSIDVYENLGFNNCREKYKVIAFIYTVIHNKVMPGDLDNSLSNWCLLYGLDTLKSLCDRLDDKEKVKLYEFMLEFCVIKAKSFEAEPYGKNQKLTIRRYLQSVCKFIEMFEKNKEDIPEIIKKFIDLDWNIFRSHSLFVNECEPVIEHLTKDRLLRLLKQDAKLVVDNLPVLKERIDKTRIFNFSQLLRKLRIYFYTDIAKDYIDFFSKLLLEKDTSRKCVCNVANVIFQLSDTDDQIEFMTKHAPTHPKIDHKNIDRHLLHIQEAICRFAYMSRPPVPLDNIVMYIKGDYIHYCLPIFNYYYSNLPPSQCLQFIELLLDSPVSIQKQALRLAFKCFDVEDSNKVMIDAWQKSKNLSLRWIIYKNLFDKILNEETNAQLQLFEALKMFTLDLHEEDNEEIFRLMVSNDMPQNLRGDYIKTAWEVVKKLPLKAINMKRQAELIECIECNINLIQLEIVAEIVEEHIHIMLDEKQLRPNYSKREIHLLNKAKWQLSARYIVCFDETKLYVVNKLVVKIFKTCFEMWNEIHDNVYTYRKFSSDFFTYLQSKAKWDAKVNSIFQNILDTYEKNFAAHEIYLLVWRLKLLIINRNIVYEAKVNNHDVETVSENFANELKIIFTDYIENKKYYCSLQNQITEIILENISSLSGGIHVDDKLLTVSVANSLTSVDSMPELYLVAIQMCTDIPFDYKNIYMIFFNKIKKYENPEVQCAFVEKFINSSFKKDFYM